MSNPGMTSDQEKLVAMSRFLVIDEKGFASNGTYGTKFGRNRAAAVSKLVESGHYRVAGDVVRRTW